MRVTIVVGGRWHAFDLAKELNFKGCLYRIITNYPSWYVQKWGIPKENIISLPTTFYLVKLIYWLGGEKLMMRCQWIIHSWFAQAAARHLEGSQLIHAWSSWAEPSIRWANKHAIPSILERSSAHILEQSQLLKEEYSCLQSKWIATHHSIEEMECREYMLASIISVPSRFVQESFLRRGFTPKKVKKHLLGASLQHFKPSEESIPSPSISGLKVLFVGSLTPQKGIHYLLKAFNQYSCNQSILTLLGGGTTTEIKRLLRKLNDQRIRTPGHLPQSDLPTFYHQHHVLVLPSIQDGFGMVLAQAICSGIPIIATMNTGGRDLLELDGSQPEEIQYGGYGCLVYPAGWIVPPRAPEALASIFRELFEKPELWINKCTSAIKLREKNLSWDAYASSLCRSYSLLLSDEPS